MSAIPFTTIDLVLNLALKLVDAFVKAQGKRINPTVRQELEAFQRSTEAYSQIRKFLSAYRQAWDRALGGGDFNGLYALCTQQGYAQQLDLIRQYQSSQIIQSFVHTSDVLDIRLISTTENMLAHSGAVSQTIHRAEVYIYSIQTLRYQHGINVRVSSLHLCRLLNLDHNWKLDAVESLCRQEIGNPNY